MAKQGERTVLLKLIEQLGREWEERDRPEDIRLSADKIDALMSVGAIAADTSNDLDVATLRASCPSFCRVYREVLLRDIEERTPNGSTDS